MSDAALARPQEICFSLDPVARGSQQQRQRRKLYSFHAPEVEYIRKGKAAAPYEPGIKASVATTNGRAPGPVRAARSRTARQSL